MLIAAAVLIAFTIACAVIGHLAGAAKPLATGTELTTRELLFIAQPDNRFAVLAADTNTPIRVFTPQTDGFAYTVILGLQDLRRQAGKNAAASFRLTAWRDNRLTLDDSATGTRLDLEAFGPTNEAVFSRLLKPAAGQ